MVCVLILKCRLFYTCFVVVPCQAAMCFLWFGDGDQNDTLSHNIFALIYLPEYIHCLSLWYYVYKVTLYKVIFVMFNFLNIWDIKWCLGAILSEINKLNWHIGARCECQYNEFVCSIMIFNT
jgi:hypothetical protein